jgi:ADP-ribosylglycohydrolase
MLQGHDTSTRESLEKLIEEALQYGRNEVASNKDFVQELNSHCSVKTLAELKLDDRKTMGYTYKTIGSGIFCLRTGSDFQKAINELVMEGGDADTNGAVAGALLGCKLGYKKLPSEWLDGLKEKKWLDFKVHRFLCLLGLETLSEEDKIAIANEPHNAPTKIKK